MFANVLQREFRRQAFAAAVAGMRASAAASQGMGQITRTTYSVERDADNAAWRNETNGGTKTSPKGSKTRRTQYGYALYEAGQAEGLGWDGLKRLFGDYAVGVTVDGTGDHAFYVGSAGKLVVSTDDLRGRLDAEGFLLVAPTAAVRVDPYLLAAVAPGEPDAVAAAIGRSAANSSVDRLLGVRRSCPPFGDITREQAKALVASGRGAFSGCVQDVAELKDPAPTQPAPTQTPGYGVAFTPCPPNYSAADPACGPGQNVAAAPGRPDCRRCEESETAAPTSCPPGYYVLPQGFPFQCPAWQRRVVDQASGCVACEPAPNCFRTATGLTCAAGAAAQIYGEWTCCQAPGAPPPSAEEPKVTKAGLGTGGMIAIAAAAAGILYATFGRGGGTAATTGRPEEPSALSRADRDRDNRRSRRP